MNLFYTAAYWLGFTPWEHASTHPPARRHITALFEREESGRQPPYGRALDLGCGRGYWSVTLAQRGWNVTGVDLAGNAVRAYANGDLQPGINLATVANGGIGLASYHDWEGQIPAECKQAVDEATEGLRNGTISTGYTP